MGPTYCPGWSCRPVVLYVEWTLTAPERRHPFGRAIAIARILAPVGKTTGSGLAAPAIREGVRARGSVHGPGPDEAPAHSSTRYRRAAHRPCRAHVRRRVRVARAVHRFHELDLGFHHRDHRHHVEPGGGDRDHGDDAR